MNENLSLRVKIRFFIFHFPFSVFHLHLFGECRKDYIAYEARGRWFDSSLSGFLIMAESSSDGRARKKSVLSNLVANYSFNIQHLSFIEILSC